MWDYIVGLFCCCYRFPRGDPTYYYISYDLDNAAAAAFVPVADADADSPMII
jgi:hypothetical protein